MIPIFQLIVESGHGLVSIIMRVEDNSISASSTNLGLQWHFSGICPFFPRAKNPFVCFQSEDRLGVAIPGD